MPGLSQAFLDALSDDQLAELAKNVPAATNPPAPATAPAEPMFSLTRPTEKPARVRDPEIVAPAPAVRTTQKPLFCGLDCLPGQLDLFATDGGPRNG